METTILTADAVQVPAVPAVPSCGVLLHMARRLPDDSDARAEQIRLIAQSTAVLPPVERDTVLKALKEYTGINIGTLRSEARQVATRGGEPDHLAFARMALKTMGHENLLHADGFFWQWTGSVWRKRNRDTAVKKSVQSTIAGEGYAVTAAKVSSVTDVLRNEIYKADQTFNLGAPDTVNCLNGELQLGASGWALQPHRRENYRTTQIPVAYDPSGECPWFWWWINDVFRDDDDREAKVRSVLELIGYTLMSHAKHEKFAMLIGNGANGKSVLLSLIRALCGTDNVAAVQPSQFDNKWQRAHLHMKLANIVTELPEGKLIADAELKAITSGELTTVENKGGDPFDMAAFSTCWFGTNHLPHTRDFSEALFRRATILRFNRTYAEADQDKGLIDKLTAELPGVLNLALAWYAHALSHGFTAPLSSIAIKEKWRREADQVRLFLDECCRNDPQGKVAVNELYRRFTEWARGAGVRQVVGMIGFGNRLEDKGYGRLRSDGTWITGLALTRL